MRYYRKLVVLLLIVIVGSAAIDSSANTNTQFNRYFEEIYPILPESDSYLYIVSVGSNFVDLLAKERPESDGYKVGQGDFNGNWIISIDDPWSIIYSNPWSFISNGIRCLRIGWYSPYYNKIRQDGTTYRFGNGLAATIDENADTIIRYLDAKGYEAYSYVIDKNLRPDINQSRTFYNGIAGIGYDEQKNIYYQLDRNFQPIQSTKNLQLTNEVYRGHKLEQFKLGGSGWSGAYYEDPDKIKVPVKIMDQDGTVLKEFEGWGFVSEIFSTVRYNIDCGHILLAKGSLRDPEYLILKNKVYPYTEYGDIRFDSIRPSDKIEPSRVLDLFENRMVVRETEDAQGKVGIMDFDGNWTVAPVFDSIGQFHNGLAPARMENGNYGYIMKDGTWAIEPLYEQAADFGCGLAAVVKDGIPMYIDDSGVIQKEFAVGTELGQFSERFAWVKENGIYTLIDMEFTPQFSGNYNAAAPYCNGMSRVKLNGQEQFVNLDGEVKYEAPKGAVVSDFRDEFAIQKQDDVVTKINKSGQSVDTYDQYRNVVDLGNGLMLGETKEGGVEVFDLFGYVLEQHDKTAIVEIDSGTVLLIPEEGTWFTAIRKDDYFALWDQSYPASQLKGNDDVIALLPGENLLYLGGKAQQIDQDNEAITPVVRDERTMVPLRVISEVLGYNVNWNDPFITVTKYINGGKKKEIRMSLESTVFTVTDEDETTRRESMDVAPYEENGRTMVPLRFVAEQLGQQVYWDESGLVLISETERNLTNTNIAQYLALWNK